MKACLIAIVLCAGFAREVFAQDSSVAREKKKGSFYFMWGYNRDSYTKSDVRFESKKDNYDFTFQNAKAKDRPSVEGWWKPNRLTIPQYDLHLGYLLNDKHDLGIEVGWEHLKYVITDNQVMHMKGQIEGKLYDKDTLVTPGFIHMQHTNGNNYAIVSLVKRKHLWASRHIEVSAIGKVGAGPLMSVTISNTFGEYYRTGFQYQGWVFPVSGGLRINIYKYFFIQGDAQVAFVDYLHSRIGAEAQGKSSQHFYSLQWMWAGGFCLPIFNVPQGSR